jgi:hypothetical protein
MSSSDEEVVNDDWNNDGDEVEFSLSREEESIVGTECRKMIKEKHDVMAQLNKYIGIN